jgi:hypothetical protein
MPSDELLDRGVPQNQLFLVGIVPIALGIHRRRRDNSPISSPVVESIKAADFCQNFETYRSQARQALQFAQVAQRRYYNRGRLSTEFERGDLVLLNPHSLGLLRAESGRGKKLLMKYDGPCEISQKLSPATYRLRLPASYGIHPVLNIAHLEPYVSADLSLGPRPSKHIDRADFDNLPEFEVESILAERWRKARNQRRVQELLVRFVGYDEWLPRRNLRNAPDLLQLWDRRDGSRH